LDSKHKSSTVDFEYKHKYEELWLLSEQVCKLEDPKSRMSEILATFHAACQDHLGIFDIQARRLGRLTTFEPLVPHRTCKISPPLWSKPVEVRKKYKFNCRTSPPNSVSCRYPCVACGHELDSELTSRGVYAKCRKCRRQMHLECQKVLLLASRFTCHSIREPLEKPGVKCLPIEVIPPKPLRDSERCIVCGESCVGLGSAVVVCTEQNCNYQTHKRCVETLADINGEQFVASEYVCNHINYYLKPSEVVEYCLGNSEICKQVKLMVSRRGQIDHRDYSGKRKRYENPDIVCEKCGQLVGLNETDHALRYCSAIYLGPPIPTSDYEYTESKYKRIRRCALYDYPP